MSGYEEENPSVETEEYTFRFNKTKEFNKMV
jgi:hypothetical protein